MFTATEFGGEPRGEKATNDPEKVLPPFIKRRH
jgi:hypothetical protein